MSYHLKNGQVGGKWTVESLTLTLEEALRPRYLLRLAPFGEVPPESFAFRRIHLAPYI